MNWRESDPRPIEGVSPITVTMAFSMAAILVGLIVVGIQAGRSTDGQDHRIQRIEHNLGRAIQQAFVRR